MRRILPIMIPMVLSTLLPSTAFAEDKPILERIEWSDVWVVNADRDDLPRVLLVGDSIVKGYYDTVEKTLSDKANIARYATSKFIGHADYLAELELLLNAYEFDVIHINNGLHGWGYSEEQYRSSFPALLELLDKRAPNASVIWATSTPVRKSEDLSQFGEMNERVIERNRISAEVMAEHSVAVNDLYALVVDHPEYFSQDGVHYNDEGRAAQGKHVAESIAAALGARGKE